MRKGGPLNPDASATRPRPGRRASDGYAVHATTAVAGEVQPPEPSDALQKVDAPEIGRDIDHFRVLRLLGSGGMGRVLLARDSRLGRLVALKLIRGAGLDPHHQQALLEEARVTARLAHPNIVTIFYVGMWQQAPYMALEYIDGENLRQRMRSGPVTQPEALRWCAAIARALEAAHAAKISHCDLKPENVLLPKDGRLRVVDFGIAAVLDRHLSQQDHPTERIGVGTPPYMAPEQWLGLPILPATDLWALGVLLYELLVGERPFDQATGDNRPLHLRVLDPHFAPPAVTGASPEIANLVGKMLDRDPTRRPTAKEAAEALEASAMRRLVLLGEGESPYRGLSAFEERHAPLFFGRTREVELLAERLRVATVVPVVGPSGAGKSSLVQAGLLQRLREQGMWAVVRLRPGARPLHALAAALLGAESIDWPSDGTPMPATDLLATPRASGQVLPTPASIDALAQQFSQEPGLLNVRIHRLAESRNRHVLLFVDQLEEVATQGCSDDTATAFLTAVATAADPVDPQVRVVVTVRDDFLSRVSGVEAMRQVLPNLVVVRPLDTHALREAATRPAEAVGYRWDQPLVLDAMLADVAGQPTPLALVQFVCAEVWERRDRVNKLLRAADYLALGGVVGALAAHADAVLEALDAADFRLARAVLLELVTHERTRRVVPRRQLILHLGLRTEAVLEALTQARLLATRRLRDGSADDGAVEIAHEALIGAWPQLTQWLEESGEERAALRDLEAAAQLWRARGELPEEVWSLASVEDMTRRLGDAAATASNEAKHFLAVSTELALKARNRKRWRWGLAAAALLLITVTSIVVAAELATRERTTREQASNLALAAADMGRFELVLQPFDWDPEQLRATSLSAASLADLQWALHEPGQEGLPGPKRDLRGVRVGESRQEGLARIVPVETRSGVAHLLVSGRHRPGEPPCPPSHVVLGHLPGFANRTDEVRPRIVVPVPTCQALYSRQVIVPAGPFVEGGGDPTPTQVLPVEPERVVDEPVYRIDRTELPQALMAVFAQMASQTDLPMPEVAPLQGERHFLAPDRPVHSVDWYGARQVCRWLGGDLPTSTQVTKAGRGGLVLDASKGTLNPQPRRNFPSGASWQNLPAIGWLGKQDVVELAAVGDSRGDSSPYGVVNLAGNVAEWVLSRHNKALVGLRDGSWSGQPELGLAMLGVVNQRSPRYFAKDVGFRCVAQSAVGSL